jgi:chorismate mutase/prephenate dehydratase
LKKMSDHKREIDHLRQEIARLDAELLAALEKRAHAARSIGALRKDEPPQLPIAERAAVRALIDGAPGEMPVESLREIFREVLAACLALEAPAKVAYLAPEGGTGHAVARAHFGASATYIAAETTPLVLDEVARHRASYALLPYETHAEGPVHATIAALTASDLRIVAVVEASPNLHLVNRSGNAADIVKIFATPGDRALCERSLSSSAPSVRTQDVKSPLIACQLAAEDPTAAAVASEAVGAQLDLQVARRNLLDRVEGIRYAIVGSRPSTRTGEDSTAVVFSVRDSPGALLDVLKGFAERSVNLTKIQSRPVEAEGWSYLFFIEVAGHATDRALITAFEEVKRLTKFFKVLGSYPSR